MQRRTRRKQEHIRRRKQLLRKWTPALAAVAMAVVLAGSMIWERSGMVLAGENTPEVPPVASEIVEAVAPESSVTENAVVENDSADNSPVVANGESSDADGSPVASDLAGNIPVESEPQGSSLDLAEPVATPSATGNPDADTPAVDTRTKYPGDDMVDAAETEAQEKVLVLTGWAEVPEEALAWTVPFGTSEASLGLPDELAAEIAGDYGEDEEPDTIEVPVLWRASPAYDPESPGSYTFTAQAMDADNDPEEDGEPYWANLIAGLPEPLRQVTLLPKEENDKERKQILSVVALPEEQRNLTAAPGTAWEDLGLPETLQVAWSYTADAPESAPEEVAVLWKATPDYDPQAWRDAEAAREEALLAGDDEAAAVIETPPSMYTFTPLFEDVYLLAEGLELPEISLTLTQPVMQMMPMSMGLPSLGVTFADGTLQYTILTEDSISGYTVSVAAKQPFNQTDVTVPATVEYNSLPYTVVAVTGSGFYGCGTLESVILPSSVIEIGFNAFQNCTALSTFTADGVIRIGNEAFRDCSNLHTISLPAVVNIETLAFQRCHALTTLMLPNAEFLGIGAFNSCEGLTSVDLPRAKHLGETAFLRCDKLKTVSLPSIEMIGAGVFYACEELVEVILSDTLLHIGYGAFEECYKLTTIKGVLPDLSILTSADTPIPTSILSQINITCPVGAAWQHENTGLFKSVTSQSFAPILSASSGQKAVGQPFQVHIDFGCSAGVGLNAGILEVTGGQAANFSYTPYVNVPTNISSATPNVIATVDITPTGGSLVTVQIKQNAFTFFGTGNNASNLLTETVTEPVVNVTGLSVNPAKLEASGGSVRVSITGSNLTGHALEVRLNGVPQGNATILNATSAGMDCQIPENSSASEVVHSVGIWLNGVDTGYRAAVTVAGRTIVTVPEITGLTASVTVLPWQGGDVDLTVTGNNLTLANNIGFTVDGKTAGRMRVLSDTEAFVALTVTQNGTAQQQRITLAVLLDGKNTGYSVTIVVRTLANVPLLEPTNSVGGVYTGLTGFGAGGMSTSGGGTPEYMLVYVRDRQGTLLHTLDTTESLVDEAGIRSFTIAEDEQPEAEECIYTMSLRMLYAYGTWDETGAGCLELERPDYQLRVPYQLLWKPVEGWEPRYEGETPTLELLPEIEAYLDEHNLQLAALRLWITLTPAEDGQYEVRLQLCMDTEDSQEPLEDLRLPTLFYPLQLRDTKGEAWVEIPEDGEYLLTAPEA